MHYNSIISFKQSVHTPKSNERTISKLYEPINHLF